MNRSRKGSQQHPHALGTVTANLAIVWLLILVFGATKPTMAQDQNPVTPTATPTVTTTSTATATWTVMVTLTPTTTRTPTASPTASPSATASATLVPPTFTPSASPEPTTALDLAPTVVPTFIAPVGVNEPDGVDARMLLLAGIALIALAAIALIAALLLRKRRKRVAPPEKPTPSSEAPQVTAPIADDELSPSLLTPNRPQPGAPYLESQGRPAGVLYCLLSKPAITVGRRAGSDLSVDATFTDWQTVSREHATVEYDGVRAIVSDRGSRTGVFVNGKRTGTSVLRDGCVVSFGHVRFVFRSNQGGGAK